MVNKLNNLKGKKCLISLINDDSHTGVIEKIEFNSSTTAVRVIFVIESGKGLIIPIINIKSIFEETDTN